MTDMILSVLMTVSIAILILIGSLALLWVAAIVVGAGFKTGWDFSKKSK